MVRFTMIVRRTLILLLFTGAFLPVLLWQHRLDDRIIALPFNNLVFYLPDLLAVLLVTITLNGREPGNRARWGGDTRVTVLLLAVAALNSLSLLWALNTGLALATALHWWLVVGVYFSIVTWGREDWRRLIGVSIIILLAEFAVGLRQISTGATVVGRWIGFWPEELLAQNSGASVVMNAAGERLLRAYGTFEHPNHLGGYVVVLDLILTGAILVTVNKRARWLFAAVLCVGVVLLGMTFSRGAWIAFGASGAYLLLCAASKFPLRAAVAGGAVVVGALLFLSFAWPWARERMNPSSAARVEHISLEDRAELTASAWSLIGKRPWTGVGAGNYVRGIGELTDNAMGIPVPAHNMALVALGELGVAGGALVVAWIAFAISQAWSARGNLVTATGTAIVLALLLSNAFDLYFWDLQPGRLVMGMMLGLWSNSLAQ